MGAGCAVPSRTRSGFAAGAGSGGFSRLEDAPQGGRGTGAAGLPTRLQAYAVPSSGGGVPPPGGDASAPEAPAGASEAAAGPAPPGRPSFRTLAKVVIALQQDHNRAAASAASASAAAAAARPFAALPPLPPQVASAVAALSFERFVVGNVLGQLMVLNWTAVALEASWAASDVPVTTLEPCGDGECFFSGAASGEVVMWDRGGGKRLTLSGHTQEVRTIVRIGSGDSLRLATGGQDCTVRTWGLQGEGCLHKVLAHGNAVTCMRPFPADQVAVHGFAFVQASEDLRLRFWGVDSCGKLGTRRLLHAGREQFASLDVSPCGRFVAAGARGSDRDACELGVWDMRTMEKKYGVNAFDSTVEALRIVLRAPGVMQILAVSRDATMKCFTFPELEQIWEESAVASAPYVSLDFHVDASGQAALFAATAEPEAFVWSWPLVAADAYSCGSLRGGARRGLSLDHPPLLRARTGQAGTAVGSTSGSAPAPPRRMGSLGAILSQAEQDATSFEAKQRLTARMLIGGPSRVPRRDRIKGVSPLVRASKKAADEDVRRIFADIDRDADGWIDAEELREYLGDYLGFGEKEISRFLQRASAAAPAAEGTGRGAALTFEAFRSHYALLNAVFISQRHGECFLRRPGAVGRQQFCLEECTDCQVLVCDMTDQVFVDQCKGCRVLLGPAKSSTFVRDCTDCVFWIATQQLRTRGLKRCTIHLFSHTEPIIEESSDIRFAPWTAAYPRCGEHFREVGYDAKRNMWNAIYDFTPASGRANWSIVPFDKCECMTVAFEELSEDRKQVLPADNPCPLLSHELLCAAPLEGLEHTGHGLGACMEQVRPAKPPRPPEGATPAITVERDCPDDSAVSVAAQAAPAAVAVDAPPAVERPAPGTPPARERPAAARGRAGAARAGRTETSPAAAPLAGGGAPPPRPSAKARRHFAGGESSGVEGLAQGGGASAIKVLAGRAGAAGSGPPRAVLGSRESALGLLRQQYGADGVPLPEVRAEGSATAPLGWPPAGKPLGQAGLGPLREDDERRAEEAEREAEEEERALAKRAEDERLEESALEQAWEEATEKNRDDAARPSLWRQVWEERPLEYGSAWLELLSTGPGQSCERPVPAVPKLGAAASSEKDALVGVCRTKLLDDCPVHLRLLQTVWRRLSSSGAGGGPAKVPPRVGAHWQSIGFQGDDPATDLRGVGVLGLLQLLALAERSPAALRAGLSMSRHRSSHFPFAAAAFNFSKMAVDLLLQGKLTSECNRQGGAAEVVLAVYIGTFKRFLDRWQRNGHTVKDFGQVLRELEGQAGRNPQLFVQEGTRGDDA